MASVAGPLPKELLPVAGKPLLQWTLDEAAAAGLDRAVVITSPDKPQIAKFLSDSPTIRPSVAVVIQPSPRGLGDAITCARTAAGGDSIAVLLPDNLFPGSPAIAPVLDAHRRTGHACVLISEVGAAVVGTRGAVGRAECRRRPDGLFDVLAVAGKTAPIPSALTPIGRMVFSAEVFDHLERLRGELAARGAVELDDVPLMQQLAAQGRLIGVPLAGPFFDVGLPDGYRDALAALS